MKKYVFILMLLMAYKTIFAQSFITNREAFDFSVGDIFQYEIKTWTWTSNPDYVLTYREAIIVEKWYNEKQDSLFYRLQNYPNKIRKILSYGRLDSAAVEPYFRKCKPDASTYPRCFDSIYVSANGLKTSEVRYNHGLYGFSRKFMQGLGIVAESAGCDVCAPFSERLIYYKKNNQAKGTRISNSGLSNFIVYPNPAASTVHIVGNTYGRFDEIWITDVSGRIIMKIDKIPYNQYDLPLKDINNGLYFLFMYNEGVLKEMKRLAIQH
jgi:hypothetical protein